jgi:hypothetical protein
MSTNSLSTYRISVLSLACTTALGLSGCLSMVRDQVQIDPMVKYKMVGVSRSLPKPEMPMCPIEFWLKRANGTEVDFSGCGSSATNSSNSNSNSNSNKTLKAPSASGTAARNQVQAEMMLISDSDCSFYQAGMFGTQAGWNLGTSLGANMLSGLAALNTGGISQNYAAGGAFLGATRSQINADVYANYIASAVITEVTSLRREARRVMSRKRSCSLQSYPPAAAVNDAMAYHEMCSFVVGLTSLLDKAGVQKSSGDPEQARTVNALAAQRASIEAQLTTEREKTTPDADVMKTLSAELQRVRSLEAIIGPARTPEIGLRPDSFDALIAEQESIVATRTAEDKDAKTKAAAAGATAATKDAATLKAAELKSAQDVLLNLKADKIAQIALERDIQQKLIDIENATSDAARTKLQGELIALQGKRDTLRKLFAGPSYGLDVDCTE